MTTWFVLTVTPQREKIVEAEIKRGLGLLSYVPYERFSVRRAARTIEVVRPLIPGYVFAGTRTGFMPWKDIDETRHVYDKLKRENDQPYPLADAEIDRIRQAAEQFNASKEAQKHLQPGDRVRVTDGPFRDIQTTIAYAKGAVVKVTVPMLGGERQVALPAEHVEAV